jgi:putative FmdB family regulatory protein
MPTYEYECTACGQHMEVFQRFSEDALTTCGVCGGVLRKVFHPAGIVFKGSGFYATDSRAPAKTGSGSKKDSDGGSSSSFRLVLSSDSSGAPPPTGISSKAPAGSSKGSEQARLEGRDTKEPSSS